MPIPPTDPPSRRTASPVEISGLLVLALAAASLLLFVLVADGVREGATLAFDEAVLRSLRRAGNPASPIGPAWLEIAVRDFTSLGSTAVLATVTLLTAGYLAFDGKRAAALFVVLATGGGMLLSFALKIGFDRPRPDVVDRLVDVHTLSFPSGHAMGAAVTYLTLGVLIVRTESKRRLKVYVLAVALLLTLTIGLSRIYLGVHWPTDVLAGWCAGSAWALLCWLVASWLQRRGQIEPADPN
ncbi:phosphatase PAP2 family protein [Ancylobacter oerskovii]|uniref:Phosphatase PAP2 family protein n=1 Tax=Ancylobacter oerskovii TaxID=459519 RepID=A0ABW4YRQ1_9HYPH|nr:phosphatase PAP2 family protein [Ancylobacter oerskovii]MBS7545578.1 phosphatase PAP2 family protein [Ancylobacter oerskovii]